MTGVPSGDGGARRRGRFEERARALVRRALNRLPGRADEAGGARRRGAAPAIGLHSSEEPAVTIVIPVHGHWGVTADCLRSIAADRPATPYEVLVVDDASPDDTGRQLERVTGLRVLTLEVNHGFLGAVNAALPHARGGHVVLLNNDTVVQPGWLDALVTVVEDPAKAPVGVVGAKLVYPDGRLQEAGGIIWHDASGYNVGRGGDAGAAEVSFVRDVDYCSGACLLVRASLLRELGGLDPRFAPAYYEDTDLCFAARSRGYRVLYQPGAVVCHVEGASHGTDVTAGVKRHQALNQTTFRQKWAAVLDHHPGPDLDVRRASWRRPAGRALVVDRRVPGPRAGIGTVDRAVAVIGELEHRGFAVTWFAHELPQDHAGVHALNAAGAEVLSGPDELAAYLGSVGEDLRLVIVQHLVAGWYHHLQIRSQAPYAPVVVTTPAGGS